MEQEFRIRQIYLKDASFQAPMGIKAFTEEWSPKVDVDVQVQPEPLGNDIYEVTLRLSVVSRTGANTHFMIEIVQAGLFIIRGHNETELTRVLHALCPETLYPYAREAVDSFVSKGRFPSLLLAPIDFAANHDR